MVIIAGMSKLALIVTSFTLVVLLSACENSPAIEQTITAVPPVTVVDLEATVEIAVAQTVTAVSSSDLGEAEVVIESTPVQQATVIPTIAARPSTVVARPTPDPTVNISPTSIIESVSDSSQIVDESFKIISSFGPNTGVVYGGAKGFEISQPLEGAIFIDGNINRLAFWNVADDRLQRSVKSSDLFSSSENTALGLGFPIAVTKQGWIVVLGNYISSVDRKYWIGKLHNDSSFGTDWLSVEWEEDPKLNVPRYSGSLVALADGTVMLSGGFGQGESTSDEVISDGVEILDPLTRSVVEKSSLEFGIANHSSTILDDGDVLVYGGNLTYIRCREMTGISQRYDLLQGDWSLTEPMRTPRCYYTSEKLEDGRVIVLGGRDADNAILDSVEIFDPASNSWGFGSPMPFGLTAHASVVAENGDVLVVGGWSGTSFITKDDYKLNRSVLSYDPVVDEWKILGQLLLDRAYPEIVPIGDGQYLVIGGSDQFHSDTTLTEIFSVENTPVSGK
jgi:hypothetical protein